MAAHQPHLLAERRLDDRSGQLVADVEVEADWTRDRSGSESAGPRRGARERRRGEIAMSAAGADRIEAPVLDDVELDRKGPAVPDEGAYGRQDVGQVDGALKRLAQCEQSRRTAVRQLGRERADFRIGQLSKLTRLEPASGDRPPLRIEANVSDPGNNWRFADIRASQGESTLEGILEILARGDRRMFDGSVTVTNVEYPDLSDDAGDDDGREDDGGDQEKGGMRQVLPEGDLYSHLLDGLGRYDDRLGEFAQTLNDALYRQPPPSPALATEPVAASSPAAGVPDAETRRAAPENVSTQNPKSVLRRAYGSRGAHSFSRRALRAACLSFGKRRIKR